MALVVCWQNMFGSMDGTTGVVGNIPDRSSQVLVGVEEDLIRVGKLFVKLVEREVDMKPELGPLIAANPGLKELFGL